MRSLNSLKNIQLMWKNRKEHIMKRNTYIWCLGIIICFILSTSIVKAEEELVMSFGRYEIISVDTFDFYFDKKADKVIEKYIEALGNTDDWVYVNYKPESKTSQTLSYSQHRYYGKIKSGNAHGIGVVFRGNFPIYIGEFKKGYRSGYGIELMTQADDYYSQLPIISFEGEFDKGKYDGKGIEYMYEYNDGTTDYYDADLFMCNYNENSEYEFPTINYVSITPISSEINYSKGKAKGKGKEYSLDENGDVHLYFEGEYKNDSKVKGTIYYWGSDQKRYEGEFKKDVFHGKGVLYNEDGTIQYKGKFWNGDIKN